MKPTPTEPTYLERSAKLKAVASAAEFQKIKTTYGRFDAATKEIEKNSLTSVNLARELGIHLQTLCGHEQIDFDFWQSHCEGNLPFKFDSAKMFVGIARKMPEKAKSLQEAVQFVQQVLVADGVLMLPERPEPQQRSSVSVVQRFFNEFTLLRQPWEKIVRNRPLEEWDAPALDTFLSETEWLAFQREKAQKLREKVAA